MKRILLLFISVFSLGISFGQVTIYSENFTGQNDKGTIYSSTDMTGVTWSIDISDGALSANTDWFAVKNEIMEARDVDGDVIWYSPSVSIAAYTNVQFSLDASESGTMESSDIFETYYRINGGTWIEASTNGSLSDDFSSATVSQTGLSGNTLELRVTMNNGAGSEYHRLDNVLIEGTAASGNIITVTQATGGTIAPGTTNVADNGSQSFTTTADACYTFTNWVVDGVNAGSTNPYDFTNVTADHTITAVYTQDAYNITATAGANGSISPSGVTSVNCGDDQSYTFTADAGYAVDDVLVDGVSVGAVSSYDFTNVTAAHTISVSYVVYVGPCFSMNGPDFPSTSGYTTSGDTDSGGSPTTTIRLASGGSDGSISTTATGVTAGSVTVKFRAKGWSASETTVTVTFDGVSQTISTLSTTFTEETLVFTTTNANPTLTFSADADERVHIGNVEIYCAPVVASSEINVQGNSTDIADGETTISTTDDTDFGDVLITGGSQANTFTIQNTGTSDLTLTSVASSNASDFVVSGTTSGVIAAGDSVTFTVTFDPSTIGTKTSTITIESDDADEASYTFNVAGNAIDIPSIVLSSANPALAATNIVEGSSNHVIYAFQLDVSNFDAELTAINLNTSGTYAAGNLNNFKAWYSADAVFNTGPDVELVLFNASDGPMGPGSHLLTGFSQTITNGSTGYIFITTNLPCPSTNGNTLIVDAITTADLTFVSGNKSGTAYASATHTIVDDTPINVSGLATANCENGGVDLSWTAASGCQDIYLVVASPTALSTAPSGDGSSYSADAVYGSGTAYDGGYVVYKGTGTSVSISGLTNGTNYTYTVFTRNSSTWSSGVEVDCTPSVSYCTSSFAGDDADAITNVTINTINNNSGNAEILSSIGYEDFTSISTTLQQSSTHLLEVSIDPNGSFTYDVWAFFDWDGNGSFGDAVDESYDLGDRNSIGVLSTTITVPSSIVVNNARMRIVMINAEDPLSCDPQPSIYGETEDYTINVISSCTPTHTFTSMVPTSGPVETEVTITGTGFSASTTASFGGVSATVDFVDATTLIVHVPATATTGTITLTEAACDIETGTFTIIEESGPCSVTSGSFTDIIISEVYDSETNNAWYMELYNPTSSAIDLGAGDFEIERYGDYTDVTPDRTIDIVGSIAPNSVFVLRLGDNGDPCNTVSFDLVDIAQGINEADKIILTKGGLALDVVHTPNEKGYSISRNYTATGPTATYNASDWTTSSSEDCSDLGSFTPVTPVSPPTISAITDASDCSLLDYSITATAGNSGTLTYQWYYTDGVAAGWTAVNSTNLSGYIILGEDGDNLLIEGDTNPLSDLDTYQFYCEVTEDGSCADVSNAEKFTFNADRYYKSVAAGNWDVVANWQMAPTAAGPWAAACTYPTESNSDYISIENGFDITLNIDLAADQIIVQSGAKLTLDQKLTVANGNTSGEDLEVIGTLQDNGATVNGVEFVNGGTWKLDANGTIIKTWTSSVNNYRDAYETGIANIPATADWAFVYDGSGDVTVGSVGMYYPNLHFESTAGNYVANGMSEVFQGSTGFTTVKGDLSIGVGSISGGTDSYKVYHNNINAQPMLILGDVYIEAGSEFTNLDIAAGTDNGTGIEVKGDFLVDGILDMTNGTGITLLSGTAKQDIVSLGTGEFKTYEFEIANTLNAELDGIDVEIDNTLTFTDGKIITDVTTADMVWVKNQATTAIVGGVAQSGNSKYVEGKLQWTTDGTSTYTFPIGDATHEAQGFTIDLVSGTAGAEILAFLDLNNSAPILAYAYCDLETNPGPAGATINAGNGTAGYDGVLDQIEYNIKSPLQWNITNPSTEKITEYNLVVLATGTQDINPVTTANGVDVRYLMKNGAPGNPGYATTNGNPNFSATGFDACPNQYTLSGLTSFSKFTLDGATQTATTLPVDLLYFNAKSSDNKTVQTTWATVTEINNDYFTVERSKDGEVFEFVGKVQGAGNYNGQLNYSLVDETPYMGTSYYRLKQTDFDGQFEYSNVVAVNLNTQQNTTFNVYPIPFSQSLTVRVNSDEQVNAIIYGLSGKMVLRDVFVSTKTIDVAQLAAGTYFINLKTNTISEMIKLIKK